MPTSYTSLLGLALPVTGELSGTWGDTVNDYITKYLDAAVAGAQTISGSQTAVTLTTTTATTLSQAGSGATGSAQYQIINCTGNPASLLTITVPAQSKAYLVLNATSTSQSVKVVGAGPTTGVTMVSGERALIAWDGSDFVKVASSTADGVTTLSFGTTGLTPNSATAGAITVAGTLVAANGGTGQSSYTTGDLLYATGSTALSKLGIGTNGQVLTSTGTAPQWSTLSGVAVTTFSAGTTGFTPSTATSGAVTLAGTLATTNGGTGLTSFTANGVVYASSTSALATGSALTFNGTNLFTVIPATGTAYNRTESTQYSTWLQTGAGNANVFWEFSAGTPVRWVDTSAGELMRLNSTGLGIGTSSPAYKLDVNAGASGIYANFNSTNSSGGFLRLTNSGTVMGLIGAGAQLGAGNASDLNITSANNLIFGYNGGTRGMTLDSSGNLGLGVTPSVAYGREFTVGAEATNSAVAGIGTKPLALDNGNAYYAFNAQNTGAFTWQYRSSQGAVLYEQNGASNPSHAWFVAPSGTAGNAISFTQAMTLGADGNLLVGTTSSTSGIRLDVQGASGANSYVRTTSVGNSTRSGFRAFGKTSGGADVQLDFIAYGDSPEAGLNVVTNHPLTFATNNTERARITSGGYSKFSNDGTYTGSTGSYHEFSSTASDDVIRVRNKASSSPLGIDNNFSAAAPNNTANYFLQCRDTGGERATIRSNGGLANYQGNDVNLSDRREKTNFAPAKSYLDTICAIPVQTFNYIDQSENDPGLTLGVVAQDVQAVAPELVTESDWSAEKDGSKMRLSIYQTDLQYALMKCIQELKAQNDDLRARVAQLEAK